MPVSAGVRPRPLLLALAGLLLAAAPARAQDPAAEEAAWSAQYRQLDAVTAIRAYGALIQDLARALAAERDPARAQALADRIELAALQLHDSAEAIGNVALAREALAGAAVPERFGMAWALVHQLDADRAAQLGLLTHWQFLGPFDNERGAAMQSALPAEAEPGADLRWPGKVREVGWRETPPAAPPDGVLRFGQLLRPWEQSALLARTWLRADAEVEALLLLGAGEEARAWLNGAPILDAFEAHEFGPDALAAPCRLRAGWNELTIKLGARDEDLSLRARLVRAADGSPLRLEHGVPADAPAPCVLGAQAAPPADPRARPGALARLIADSSPRGRMELGEWMRVRRCGPRHAYPGRAELDAAAAAAPDDLRIALVRLDHYLPRSFELEEELDVNPWLQAIRAVQRIAPGEPMATWCEGSLGLDYQGNSSRALEAAARLLEAMPDSFEARRLQFEAADQDDLSALAVFHARQLLAHRNASEVPRTLVWLSEHVHRSDSPEHRAHLQRASERSGELWILDDLLAAEAAARPAFDPAAERAALARRLALDPWNPDPRLQCARRFLAANLPAEAEALAREALDLCPEHAPAHSLLARARLAQDDLPGAVAALESAQEFDFSDEDERRLLEHLLAAARGASFEADYAEPLAAIIARSAGAPAAAAGTGSEILLWRTVVRVHPDGTSQQYSRKVVRILDEKGARSYDRVGFGHAYGEQDLLVLAADVLKSGGALEHARTGRGGRAGTVDLPPLAAGDVVDLEWRVDDLRPSYFGRYFGFDHPLTPDPSVPVAESEVVLLVPPELPLQLHVRNLPAVSAAPAETARADGLRELRWRLADVRPARVEHLMSQPEEFVPAVQASSYASWEDLGAWWWNLIAPGIVSSPEMRAKVAELTAGRDEPLEKVRALYEFVANDVRYNAWEFGVHGYQPYSAPVIFSRKFGDCKDKAILLRAMLAEVGVEAYPVLVNRAATAEWQGRRPQEDLSLALVGHFNHCIAYLPEQPGIPELWLDGTARLHPLQVLPYDDRGAEVLIVRPDGVERARIPAAVASEHRESQRYEVELRADGSAKIRLELAPTGRYDAQYRALFAVGDAEARERAENTLTGLLGPFQGELELTLPDVEDLSAPRVYGLGAEFGSFARPAESGLELPASLRPLQLLSGSGLEAQRGTDLVLDGAMTRDFEMRIRLPEGWKLAALPDPVAVAGEDATYSWSVESAGAELLVRERFELLNARVPAERYGAYRELCRIVDQTQKQELRLEPARP